MGKPLVSIITPSYNRVDFIKLCINSVRAQTYANVEHIIVDGGSNDGTVEILRQYEKSSNLRWISEGDEGMYHAINKGVALAKGDIIAYLNTDDAYFPWSVETAVRNLTSEVPIVYGDLCVIKRLSEQELCYLQLYMQFDRRFYTHFGTIAQPTVFLKREVFDRLIGFDTSYKLCADREFWLRCTANGYLPKKIDEILAVQIDHEATLREVHGDLIRQEFSRLRSRYRVTKLTDYKLLGKVQNSLSSRYYKLLFFWSFFNKKNRWPQFIAVLQERNVTFNGKEILETLSPGFLSRHRRPKVITSSIMTPRVILSMIKAEKEAKVYDLVEGNNE